MTFLSVQTVMLPLSCLKGINTTTAFITSSAVLLRYSWYCLFLLFQLFLVQLYFPRQLYVLDSSFPVTSILIVSVSSSSLPPPLLFPSFFYLVFLLPCLLTLFPTLPLLLYPPSSPSLNREARVTSEEGDEDADWVKAAEESLQSSCESSLHRYLVPVFVTSVASIPILKTSLDPNGTYVLLCIL